LEKTGLAGAEPSRSLRFFHRLSSKITERRAVSPDCETSIPFDPTPCRFPKRAYDKNITNEASPQTDEAHLLWRQAASLSSARTSASPSHGRPAACPTRRLSAQTLTHSR